VLNKKKLQRGSEIKIAGHDANLVDEDVLVLHAAAKGGTTKDENPGWNQYFRSSNYNQQVSVI